jgi:hypothetical protein
VVERHRAVVPDGLPERAERGLLGAQPGLDAEALLVVVLVGAWRCRGLELEQGACGGARQRGALPDPGGNAEHRRLVGLEPDLGELVILLLDAVAGLLVERVVHAGLQRDAQLPELLLVALEHPLEGLVLVGVAAHRGADLLGGQVPAGGQQQDDDGQQALGPALRHRVLPDVF